jgi:hypothetical protein
VREKLRVRAIAEARRAAVLVAAFLALRVIFSSGTITMIRERNSGCS